MTDISVHYLKSVNCSSLSTEEKIQVKSVGRPKPNITITSVTRCKSREYKRTFKIETYEKNDWLCGCDVSNSLYCFPCLVVGDDDTPEWTKIGVRDLIHLSEKIKKHENSKSHLFAKFRFNLLGKQDIRRQLNSSYRLSIETHNEQVKNNRNVLSKIINCIKGCDAFELALRGHEDPEDPFHPGAFSGLINFSAELDLALKDHLQHATVFKSTSQDIQNDLLDCMLSVCQAHIKKEIAASTFVSFICNEATDISNIFQLVIVYRYTLPNGSPVERFWSFVKPSGHAATAVSHSIQDQLNRVLTNPYQLISQSYDGASIMNSVQKLIKDKYTYAHYIHCYANELNLVMSRASSLNTSARIFFAELSEIACFFSNSPHRIAILDEVVRNSAPRATAPTWDFKMGTINTVYENRESLIECMETLLYTSRQSETIMKAGAFLRLLTETKFIFWLSVFHRITPHVNNLDSQLQTAINSKTVSKCISDFGQNIQNERNNMYTVGEIELEHVHDSQVKKRMKMEEEPSHEHDIYTAIQSIKAEEGQSPDSSTAQAIEVCDAILSEILRRYSFTGHLEIAHLFSVEKFDNFSANFPVQHLDSAIVKFPFLNRNKLRAELEIIYKTEDFKEVSGAVLLFKFLIENHLEIDFSETFKVLQAIVTMPMVTVEADRCFSTLKRINTFLRSTMGEDRLTALAMLSIEKKMIQEIPNFNDLVIEEFISKTDRRIDFQYKTCCDL